MLSHRNYQEANLDAALTTLNGGRVLIAQASAVDPADVARAVLGAAALPALVLFLATAADALAANVAEHKAAAAAEALEAAPIDLVPVSVRPEYAARLNATADVLAADPNATPADVAAAVGFSETAARRAITRLADAGIARQNGHGWQVNTARVGAMVGANGADVRRL